MVLNNVGNLLWYFYNNGTNVVHIAMGHRGIAFCGAYPSKALFILKTGLVGKRATALAKHKGYLTGKQHCKQCKASAKGIRWQGGPGMPKYQQPFIYFVL